MGACVVVDISKELLMKEIEQLRQENAELRIQLKCKEVESIGMTLEELEESFRKYYGYDDEVIEI